MINDNRTCSIVEMMLKCNFISLEDTRVHEDNITETDNGRDLLMRDTLVLTYLEARCRQQENRAWDHRKKNRKKYWNRGDQVVITNHDVASST